MKKQIDLLVALQEKDRLIDQLGGQILTGPKRIETIETKLRSAEAGVESHKARIQDLKKSQRMYEAEIEDGIAHIRRSRGRLMTIKNNREYRALVREIEETEKENSSKEDKVLSCLEELENLAQELKDEEKAIVGLRETAESEKKAIEEELAERKKELSLVNEGKQELLRAIDRNLLGQYNRIKARSRGVAIAVVNNATCSACHMNIPPQMYNELQRQDSLQHCPHCQRLIYWKEAELSS